MGMSPPRSVKRLAKKEAQEQEQRTLQSMWEDEGCWVGQLVLEAKGAVSRPKYFDLHCG